MRVGDGGTEVAGEAEVGPGKGGSLTEGGVVLLGGAGQPDSVVLLDRSVLANERGAFVRCHAAICVAVGEIDCRWRGLSACTHSGEV